MDLDVVFLPIPIIKRKRLVWLLGCTGWKRRLVQAAIPGSELAFLAASAPDSQAEMNPTSTISQHLEEREQPSHHKHRNNTRHMVIAFSFRKVKYKLCPNIQKRITFLHFSSPPLLCIYSHSLILNIPWRGDHISLKMSEYWGLRNRYFFDVYHGLCFTAQYYPTEPFATMEMFYICLVTSHKATEHMRCDKCKRKNGIFNCISF